MLFPVRAPFVPLPFPRALHSHVAVLCSCLAPWFCADLQAQNQYVGTIVQYSAGTGANPRYVNPEAVLGLPSRVNPFGDAVDPFNPPYDPTQLVSIGAGGSLTVAFPNPIANHPGNLFGDDFLVYGGAGFIITNSFDANFNWIGTPATDGTLFGSDTSVTKVSVSLDGSTFYSLDPSKAPQVESLFPTDGAGSFEKSVDPNLKLSDFAGLTLEGIRQKYAGSAGGTGFDLSWARDGSGNPVALESVQYLRIEVVSGKVEIDAISGLNTVPEPSSWALLISGGTLALVCFRNRKP